MDAKAQAVVRKIDTSNFSNKNGLITLKKDFNIADTLEILNEDGTIWYQFSFKYNDSDGKYDFYNESFRPFAFHPDTFTLALRTTSTRDNFYKVVVNEETGLEKFIDIKNQEPLVFYTWRDYILNAYSVEFNDKENPILETIAGKPLEINSSNNYHISPKEIQDNWLKLEVKLIESNKTYSGWIKWKDLDTGKILIKVLTD
ncbi:hypothetical protein [Flavobacterium sp. CS20]|uniref:hypothetical protein n=1 Tax=Flavobacterium sp. CS20 TaxID=2775246 RepID=UPI001B3A3120|nr:hypothetical protein [Flavobacterium sp. CS20]QTY27568.1 hypothetical protein IGB25_03185 [Flavobacterium sp. CS20]QTY27599.1 hypothetical protein IGB25_03370 [Flavobacterium sp. CS20]